MSQANRPDTTSRRTLLAGAAAVVVTTAAASLATAEPDPIFALIERHRALVNEWYDALDLEEALSESEEGTPEEMQAAANAASHCCDRDEEMVLALLTASPTTLAGAVALLDHVGQKESLGRSDIEEPTILSAWTDGACPDSALGNAAKALPARLAATMRAIMGRNHERHHHPVQVKTDR
jgi:hypothetical protein